MKNGLKAAIIFLLLGLGSIYLFIPSTLRVSSQTKTNSLDKTLFSLLSDTSKWKSFPDQKDSPRPFALGKDNAFQFHITGASFPNIALTAQTNHKPIAGTMEIIPNPHTDSSQVIWQFQVPTGYFPWSRLQAYYMALRLKNSFSATLSKLTALAGNLERIYGIPLTETQVTDTLVATLIRYQKTYPSDTLLCNLADTLKFLIGKAGLAITDSVMMIRPVSENGRYKIMLGFPVNTRPAGITQLSIKKMIPGKLLLGTVKGGHTSINHGYAQMEKYVMDRYLEEAALPYEVPITNRCAEKDTTQWLTRICFPVF